MRNATIILAAAAAAAAIAATAIGLVVALDGSSHAAAPPVRLAEAATVNKLFAGVWQHGNVLGKANARVTLVEYLDLQCPYCGQFDRLVVPDVVKLYVRTGKVRLEVVPLAFVGPDSIRGRNALIAAGHQNRFFQFMELLYANQATENTGWLNDAMVKNAAFSIPGVDLRQLLADQGASRVAAEAKAFDADAKAANVRSTPTVLVGKTGGALHVVTLGSPTDEGAVVEAITRNL